MEFPAYVQSVVKYKSPHPGELSFSKGEVIRVLGYAERIDPVSYTHLTLPTKA